LINQLEINKCRNEELKSSKDKQDIKINDLNSENSYLKVKIEQSATMSESLKIEILNLKSKLKLKESESQLNRVDQEKVQSNFEFEKILSEKSQLSEEIEYLKLQIKN